MSYVYLGYTFPLELVLLACGNRLEKQLVPFLSETLDRATRALRLGRNVQQTQPLSVRLCF